MVDNAEWVTMVGTSEPIAKREHRCAECGRTIAPGERYLSERYTFEGLFKNHKTCAHCRVARAWLHDECGGYIYGGVEEDVREHCHGHGYRMDLYRLAVGMEWGWRTPKGKLLPVPRVPMTGHEIAALRGEEAGNG